MSLSYQNYYGQMLWIANNGHCRFVVSRSKAFDIFEASKARAAK
ncbi:hypothetical protein [Aliivibrio logei]|nr:hypothetical protein [Aliivibrio logei]